MSESGTQPLSRTSKAFAGNAFHILAGDAKISAHGYNNFDFLRFVAASLVLFSHSFPLVYGNEEREPLRVFSGADLSFGRIAVIVFFIVSGFLISASWEKRREFPAFMLARVLRIFPGLAALLLLTVLGCALLTSASMQDYFFSALTYFFKNLFLYKPQYSLPGVFAENPFGSAVNGSLWTLSLEFTCYLMIGALGVAGIFKRPAAWAAWAAALALSSIPEVPSHYLQSLAPLAVWFSSGMLVYLYRESALVACPWWMPAAIIAAALYFHIDPAFVSPLIACLLIRLAYCKSSFSNFGKYGDFSYGMYIYAFPIQQSVVLLMMKWPLLPREWWLCFALSLPLTLMCAALSWHLVEINFLRLKRKALS